jgi:hypothetical protein
LYARKNLGEPDASLCGTYSFSTPVRFDEFSGRIKLVRGIVANVSPARVRADTSVTRNEAATIAAWGIYLRFFRGFWFGTTAGAVMQLFFPISEIISGKEN